MSSTSDIGNGEGGDDDGICETLRSITQSLSTIPGSTGARQSYKRRLLSFQASTYCAKPACLSPLLCARFGWQNADRDLLCCSSCRAALAINWHSGLSAKAMESICSAYRQQLSTAHKEHCPFRLEAERFFQSKRRPEGKFLFVTTFASVIPQETVKLLEHPSPSLLLRKTIREMENSFPSRPTSWEISKLDIADEIQKFHLTLKDDIKISAIDAISSVFDLLGTKHSSVILAAILGWAPVIPKSGMDPESQNPVLILGCPLCLAVMEITLRKSEDISEGGNRLSKRQKRLARHCNPHDAHRYYCPFRCGFPTSVLAMDTPIWQGLLSRLMSEVDRKDENDEGGDTSSEKVIDPEMSRSRIRKILVSGLVPNNVELEIDDELE